MPSDIVTMLILRTLPPQPWIHGKGLSDILAVEDNNVKQFCMSQGVSAEKIVVTGHIDCDDLFRVKQTCTREDFFKSYEFDLSKKLIAIGLPQLFEHNLLPWDAHAQEIEFLVQTLTQTRQNVLLMLHPKMKLSNYIYLESKYPCKINRESTAKSLPFSDVYITAGSSTCLWSVQCGIITINLGYFDWSIARYDYMSSILKVMSKADLPVVLNRLVTEESFYESCLRKAKEDSRFIFTPLDGKSEERILSLI